MRTRRTDLQEAAEHANLCMEDRISESRQAAYEAAVGSPDDWKAWRDVHENYVKEKVRHPYQLSAAFGRHEPSLRSDIDPNQDLYRVERIDGLLIKESVRAAEVNKWIGSSREALEHLTESFNDVRRDGRPTFAVFAAEFPGLEKRPDWAKQMCKRCGITHHSAGEDVTLALFRYRVQDVLDGSSWPGRNLVAVPTVIDHPMRNVFFPAPPSSFGGYAVGLEPKSDCSHLATELIHARMDYQAHHWIRVDTVKVPCPSNNDVRNLRIDHLSCIRRHSGTPNYGMGCV